MRRALAAVAAGLVALGASTVARADDARPPVVAGYDPLVGAFIRTPDGRWELNPYAMIQITHTTAGRSEHVESTGFALHAAKLILHGHILDPSVTYHFQMNLGDGKVAAEDVYLHWAPTRTFALLVGQYEVAYNRQHITLEAYQELLERSIVDARFTLQRDIGAVAYLSDASHRFEATGGIWNGARQNAPNDDSSYLATLRLAYNPFGPIAFREADLDHSPIPRLSLAAAGAYNPERTIAPVAPATTSTTWSDTTQGVLESTLRWRGLSLTSELHARRYDDGKARWDTGGFAQAGYFVVPSKVQVVARGAHVIGTTVRDTDTVVEETAGINYYIRGHRLKLQAEGSRLETRRIKGGWRARAQLEFFL